MPPPHADRATSHRLARGHGRFWSIGFAGRLACMQKNLPASDARFRRKDACFDLRPPGGAQRRSARASATFDFIRVEAVAGGLSLLLAPKYKEMATHRRSQRPAPNEAAVLAHEERLGTAACSRRCPWCRCDMAMGCGRGRACAGPRSLSNSLRRAR